MPMLEIVSAMLPVLMRTTLWKLLVEPTGTPPKLIELADSPAIAPTPPPLKVTL